MAVEKTQKLTLKNWPDKGTDTNLEPGTELVGETVLKVSCESSTCQNSIEWCLEKAGEDESSVPDDAYRILILEHFGTTKNVFCSSDCLRRWMKNYVAPLSPRERAEIETNNAAFVQPPTIQNPDADRTHDNREIRNMLAVSQSDGFAGEENSE